MTHIQSSLTQNKKNIIKEALDIATKYHISGELLKAKSLYEEILKVDPNNFVALHLLGVIAYQVGKYENAIELISKAIVINPNLFEAYNNLGNAFKAQNNIEAALTCYNKAIDINSKYAEAYNNRGNIFQNKNEFDNAIDNFKRAIEINSDYSIAYFNLGNVLKQIDKKKEAISYYKKAINKDSNFNDAIINLANTLFEFFKLDEALKYYYRALKINPCNSEAYCNIGLIMKEQGKLDSAISNIKKSIEIKYDCEQAHNNLGNIYKEQGKYSDAINSYNESISVNKNYADAYMNKGILLQERGKIKDAIINFDVALTLESNKNKIFLENQILRCFYNLNDRKSFYKKLNDLITQGYNNALIGSLCCRANLKFGLNTKNPFCNYPMDYVIKDSFLENCDFEKVFVNKIIKITSENQLEIRDQELILNGKQTAGNLFASEDESIVTMKNLIFKKLDNYKKMFKNSNEGIITNWPKNFIINGWVVSMKNGGVIQPHMHEKGWISGSIYINVPKSTNNNDGKLVVCIDERNKKKHNIIDVKKGSICLFPSSLLHYTTPFKSNEERVVLAFDLIPQ